MKPKHSKKNTKIFKLKILLFIVVCIFILKMIISTFIYYSSAWDKEDNIYCEEKSLETSQLIEDDIFQLDIDNLQNEVKTYIGDKDISISYYNLTYNQSFNISGDTQYHPASTAKLYMVLALYDAAYDGIVNISDIAYYQSSDYSDGTGVLQSSITIGKGYSLKTLSEYAIKYSDNIAYKMIRRTLGSQYLLNYCSEIFNHDVGTSVYDITMSPNDAMLVLKKLYENKNNNELYNDMIEYLKHTVFSDRLAKYLPEDIVAHKIGNYSSYVHDAGIIYSDSTYIISIYTQNDSNAYEDIAQISKLIYEWTNANDDL